MAGKDKMSSIPADMSDDLSAKMRSYLAELYRLADSTEDAEGFVTTSALADLLDVSAPAVNRMVNRLKELDLIEHEPYRGIRLTDNGQREALKQLRSHRIVESFLVSVMNFNWDEVHDEAQRMGSSLSEAIIQRMADMAGNPTISPHGEPIPTAEGELDIIDDELLCNVEAGSTVQITRLRTREGDRLQYIHALGLVPGAEIDVLHQAPFKGPLQLKVGQEYRIIGYNLAELIRVHVLKKSAS